MVATPRKCPGREIDSGKDSNPMGSTIIDCLFLEFGYISSLVGANT